MEIVENINTKKGFLSLKDYEFIDCSKGIPLIKELKPKLGTNTLVVLDNLMVIASDDKNS